ncbi:MAG TPA: carboxymuconolactone decarboxylase family protein [Edaphobacter sp.]|nr:carboxymuconolactone decarboxylase family protein [Edaphobacter sp.]
MNEFRLKYGQISPEGIAKLRELEHWVNTESGLEYPLRELVKLRASLLNGCDACVRTHTAELRKMGESEERIGAVADWRSSQEYTKRERAALSWIEVVTNIQDGHAPDAVYEEVRAVFSEVETVNLTLLIATINAWNRMAISLGIRTGYEAKR